MQISYLNSNSIRRRKAKTATLTLTLYSGGEKKEENNRRRKVSFFWSRRKRGKIFGEDLSKIAKDIEKSWFQSRSQDFCQSLEGFGFREFGLRKNFGLGFLKFGLRKKVPVS